jgi:predicted DCC family thiol-disulfide oxidoreductase YuxK
LLWQELLSDLSMASTRTLASEQPASQPPTGWLLYDADCAVCTRLARFWTPVFKRLGLWVAPLQSSWVSERTGLAPSEALRDIRLLEIGGMLVSGPDVYRYVMRRLWWAYPLYLLSIIPGLRTLFDSAYRTFARRRKTLSSSCGLPR